MLLSETAAINDLSELLARRSANSISALSKAKGDLNTTGYYAENDTIVELSVQGCGLASLPDSIWQLNHLRVLSLGENHFSSVPDSIGALSDLTPLYLHNNQLSTLPASI